MTFHGSARVRRATLALLTMTSAAAGLASQARAVDVKLVEALPRNEVYDGHLLHDGLLWETRSRQADGEAHHVDVFDATTLAHVATIDLAHTAGEIHPYGAHQVVVVGKSATPHWLTHFTVITHNGATFTSKLTTLPEQYQVESYAGTPSAMFFNETGMAAVLRWSPARGSMSQLGGDISGPGRMDFDGKYLWVVERRGFDLGDEGLVRVDPATGDFVRVYPTARQGITDVLSITGHDWVAANELLAGNVLIADRTSGQPLFEVKVKGNPRGIAQLGDCLVVALEDQKQVVFLSMWGQAPAPFDQWDATPAGDRLKKPGGIAVDQASGNIFLRSTYQCPTCADTQSSVFALMAMDSQTPRTCLEHAQAAQAVPQ